MLILLFSFKLNCNFQKSNAKCNLTRLFKSGSLASLLRFYKTQVIWHRFCNLCFYFPSSLKIFSLFIQFLSCDFSVCFLIMWCSFSYQNTSYGKEIAHIWFNTMLGNLNVFSINGKTGSYTILYNASRIHKTKYYKKYNTNCTNLSWKEKYFFPLPMTS